VGVPEENLTWLESAKQDGAEVGGMVVAVSVAAVRIGKRKWQR